MDFNEQRRMFMNMGGHPLVGHHGGLQPPQVGQQVAQQVAQQAAHSRLLLPTSGLGPTPLDTTMSMASLSSQMAVANPQLPMHLGLQQTGHLQQHQHQQQPPQQPPQPPHQPPPQLPQHPQQQHPPPPQQHSIQPEVMQQRVEERGESSSMVAQDTGGDTRTMEEVDGDQEEQAEEDDEEDEDGWCLVCNNPLPPTTEATEELIYLYQASMTVSQRRLSAMLGRLVGLTQNRAHSDVLCRRCFNLVEQVDGLEIELADTKMELVQQYEATLANRQPATKNDGVRPSLEVDVEWDDSDDAFEDEESGIRKRGRKGKRKGLPRKITQLNTKVTLEMDDDMMGMEEEAEDDTKPFSYRRRRGRPKKIKEEDDPGSVGTATKECPNCGKTINHQKYMKHLSSSHKMYPCPFCDTVFKRKVRKNKAKGSSSPKPPDLTPKNCPYCPFSTNKKKLLHKHVQESHPGQGIHACPHCTYSSSDKTYLTRHIQRKHTKEKPFACPHCPYATVEQRTLTTHIMKHTGEKPYACPHCSYAATRPTHLKLHIMKYHTSERPFKCQHCPYTTTRKVCLDSHMATHTGEKRYFCPFPQCDFATPWNNSVASHIRSKHTGEKPYQCPHCSHRASEKNNMKRHIQAKHSDVRPHSCPHCSYTASLKVSMKNHIETMHMKKGLLNQDYFSE